MSDTNLEYKNKLIVNQRGGTLEINNSTDREEIKISQFSGSNVTLNNLVNSELATNNKQTKIIFDNFVTIGNIGSEFIGKDRVLRVGENNYEIKGHGVDVAKEIKALTDWKEAYRDIAVANSQFNISRGGNSYVFVGNEIETPLVGTRATNPDLKGSKKAVENAFSGYLFVPQVKSTENQVDSYAPVPDAGNTKAASIKSPSIADITSGFGESTGTQAPGIIKFGPELSSATEEGKWSQNENKSKLEQQIRDIQKTLLPIEQKIGNGGDEIESIKRHKILNVGAIINDYPSIRVDYFGRSQPTEIGVCGSSVYKHHDYIPHVEEVDNSSNFPCGNYTLAVGNKYNVVVGAGGIQIKTSGILNIGGSAIKIGGTKVNIAGSAGIVISSENNVDILSKQIQFRSDRQVYCNSSFGVHNNIIVGGGQFIEGELYVNHITAPIEVQETQPTTAYGKLVEGSVIGYCTINGVRFEVAAANTDDTVVVYDHSHHFNNVPLRLMASNAAVRSVAQKENINKQIPCTAIQQMHERKLAQSA